MKNKWKLFMLAVLLICFAQSPAYALNANLEISDPFVTVGESFDVIVSVYDDGMLGDLTGFGFDVATDAPASVLSYTGYTMGTIFDDFSDPFNPNNVSGLYFGPGNAGEDIELATLTFEALGVGTGTIDISGLFDGLFYGLFYMFGDEDIVGSLDVSVSAAPVPEPGTFILLLTGLAGVVGMRKRRG